MTTVSRSSRVSCAAVLLVLAACQSMPSHRQVQIMERFDVQYSGRLDGTAFEPNGESGVAPDQGEPLVLHGRRITMRGDVASRLLQQGRAGAISAAGIDCVRVPARAFGDSIDDLVAADAATREESLLLPSTIGRTTHFEHVRQHAYVQAFAVQATTDAMVGDPEVGLTHEGYALAVSPGRDGTRITLDLRLDTAEVVRPLAIATGTLWPRTSPVSIQVPVLFHQQITTRVSLGATDAVCLVWPQSPTRDEVTLLVFECAAPDQVAAATPNR